MNIIKNGKLPKKKVYNFTCNNCETEFEFFREEGTDYFSQKDGNSVTIHCPLCEKKCWVVM